MYVFGNMYYGMYVWPPQRSSFFPVYESQIFNLGGQTWWSYQVMLLGLNFWSTELLVWYVHDFDLAFILLVIKC